MITYGVFCNLYIPNSGEYMIANHGTLIVSIDTDLIREIYDLIKKVNDWITFIDNYAVIQNQSDYMDVYLKNEVPQELYIAHDNMQYGLYLGTSNKSNAIRII